jgi:hypothetical protein
MRVVDEKGAAYFDHARPLFREVEREHEPGADVRGPQAR